MEGGQLGHYCNDPGRHDSGLDQVETAKTVTVVGFFGAYSVAHGLDLRYEKGI